MVVAPSAVLQQQLKQDRPGYRGRGCPLRQSRSVRCLALPGGWVPSRRIIMASGWRVAAGASIGFGRHRHRCRLCGSPRLPALPVLDRSWQDACFLGFLPVARLSGVDARLCCKPIQAERTAIGRYLGPPHGPDSRRHVSHGLRASLSRGEKSPSPFGDGGMTSGSTARRLPNRQFAQSDCDWSTRQCRKSRPIRGLAPGVAAHALCGARCVFEFDRTRPTICAT